MVVCDKDGKNEKSVRLPLNEGLAQITVLENNFNIAYSIAKEGTAWPKWEGGSKEKPAKGEYMVGQSTSSINSSDIPGFLRLIRKKPLRL